MGAKAIWIVGLALGVGLSGCQTLRDARSRIVTTGPKCAERTVQIYFDPGAAEVTPEGRAVIKEAAAQVRGCVVERVRVTGLTDAVGDPAANLELSRRRADSVTAVLAGAGLPTAEFEVAGAGEAGSAAPAGEVQPMRRRTDIVLALKPAPR